MITRLTHSVKPAKPIMEWSVALSQDFLTRPVSTRELDEDGDVSPVTSGVVARHRIPLRSDEAIGREIRLLRRARGITQKELAAVVGVTGAQLHRYETAVTRISASRLLTIAQALHVPVETLLGREHPSRIEVAPSPAPPPAASTSSPQDILEVVELFAAIEDARSRTAILSIMRLLAGKIEAPLIGG